MLKNKELAIYLFTLLLLIGIAVFVAYLIGGWLFWLLLILLGLAFAATAVFQGWRYRQLKKTSEILERILSGDFSLDIRNNTEGELSILKNQIYKVTAMLSEQAELLKKDKRFLADTMSDISHQLRTPLTSMLMMTDFLEDESLSPEQKTLFLNQIRTQLERIQWLVASLLKLSRLDAGAVEFQKESLCLETLVETALQPILIPVELKEQQVVKNHLADFSVTVDSHWTAEAVLNILKNCMEHTPKGGTLTISAENNPIYTALIIQDTGEGISEEDLPHIFERFYKGKNSSPDSVGIGLAMAKQILRSQGGEIAVESSEAGSRFIIKFYHLTTV